MLYWKYSSNRIFFLNEYWILIPSAILVNYVILRKINLYQEKMKTLKQQMEQIKRLKDQIEREKKIRRILLVGLGLNALIRGGSTDFIDADFIDVDYISCNIEEGIRYLDSKRLRNIIHDLYRTKSRDKIIYITATAVCHLANRYGQTFLALPFAIGDFGLTSVYQTIRKTTVVVLLSGVIPLIKIGTRASITFALFLVTSALRLGFNNLDFIPTSPTSLVTGSAKDLKPRIPGMTDVIVVNNRNRIKMSGPVKENQECWLPDQNLFNSNCKVKPTEVPDAIDSVLPDLKYEDTVNMQDVTGLDRVEFSDKFDLGQTKPTKPNICNSDKGKKVPPKGKIVNFLDKFGDSGPIDESEGWDTSENEFIVPEKRNIRTTNKP